MPIISKSFLPATLIEVVDKVNELDDAITEIRNSNDIYELGDMQDTLNDLTSTTDELNNRIAELETEMGDAVQEDLTTLRVDFDELTVHFENMQNEYIAISDLESRIAALESIVEELQNGGGSSSSEDISELQDRVEEIGSVTDEFFG